MFAKIKSIFSSKPKYVPFVDIALSECRDFDFSVLDPFA